MKKTRYVGTVIDIINGCIEGALYTEVKHHCHMDGFREKWQDRRIYLDEYKGEPCAE